MPAFVVHQARFGARLRRIVVSVAVLAAGSLSSEVGAQVHATALDGAGVSLSIRDLERVLVLAGIRVDPERIWRCHGEYLASVLEIDEQARAAVAPLGVVGTRHEVAESVRRASAVMRRSLARHAEAIDRLVLCAFEGASEEERARTDAVRQELRARWMTDVCGNFAITFHASVPDAGRLIDDLPPELRELPAVRDTLFASAPRRERTARELLDGTVEHRRRMAEFGERVGIAGASFEEAMPTLQAYWNRQTRLQQEALRDDPSFRVTDPLSEFWNLRQAPPEACAAAILAQREPVEAAARAIPVEQAKRLRRLFWERCFHFGGFLEPSAWGAEPPSMPLALWTARRVLSQSGVTGARRAEAHRILREWIEAEDAFKEQVALAALESLAKPGSVPVEERLRPFSPYAESHPELEELSRPFRARLARALEMPWIADSKAEPIPHPAADEMAELSAEEQLITGRPDPIESAGAADRPDGIRVDWHGRRTLDHGDVEEWIRRLGADAAMAREIERLVEEHRRAWDERVRPWATIAGEPRPGETNGPRTFSSVRLDEPEPEGLVAWRERVKGAIEPLEAAANEVDARLFQSMRSLLPERERWRVDALEFQRRAETARTISYWDISRRIAVGVEEPFGGARVDPVEAVVRARLGSAREAEVIRALAPTLAEFTPIIDRERALMASFVRLSADERTFALPRECPLKELATQAPLLELFARWRRAERASLAALDDLLTPEETSRLARALGTLRFPTLHEPSVLGSRLADELRRAAAEDADLERGMNAVARIDAAESALAAAIDRGARPAVERWSEPVPKVESLAAFRQRVADRGTDARASFTQRQRETERFAWYLARTLPPETQRRSEEFRRLTFRMGVAPPTPEPAATIAPP